jgi:hypothetical protein
MPPKGSSQLPYGPCANPVCPLGLNVRVRCGCTCGYEGVEAVDEHSIFHPECTAKNPTDACIIYEGDGDVPWPKIVSKGHNIEPFHGLHAGRALGDPKYTERHDNTGHSGNKDLRWRGISPSIADRMALQLLPPNAVLCCWCEGNYRREDNEKARRHLNAVVATHVELLPDLVVHALSNIVALQYWLAGTDQRRVWAVAGFRVMHDQGSRLQTSVVSTTASTEARGVVTVGGAAGEMASVARTLLTWLVSMSGSGSTVPGQRNKLGCETVIEQLSKTFKSVFWAMIGRHLHGVVTADTGSRVERIASGDLTVMTPWKQDFKTMPAALTVTLTNLCAGKRDLQPSQDRSDSRREQLWRAVYSLCCNTFYAINPQCCEPIHCGLNRLGRFEGNQSLLHQLHGRLGSTISNEKGRINLIFDAERHVPLRDQFVKNKLDKDCHWKFVDDNIDAKDKGGRQHSVQHSKKQSGHHALNREGHSMNPPAGVQVTCDDWVPFSSVLESDLLDHTADETAAGEGYMLSFVVDLQGYTGDEQEALVVAYARKLAGEQEHEEDMELTKADLD